MRNPELKRKLKAADRRRNRRPVPVIETTAPSERQSIDVFELIAKAILEYVDSGASEVRDAIVLSAMRSCLNGGAITGKPSFPLSQRIEQIRQRTDVNQRSFRAALKQMLKLAQEYQDSKNTCAFIRYLGILAS